MIYNIRQLLSGFLDTANRGGGPLGILTKGGAHAPASKFVGTAFNSKGFAGDQRIGYAMSGPGQLKIPPSGVREKIDVQFWAMLLMRSYTSVGLVLFRAAIFFKVNSSEASIPCFFNSRTTNFIFRLNWVQKSARVRFPVPGRADSGIRFLSPVSWAATIAAGLII